jgi:adenylosuccinate synthase
MPKKAYIITGLGYGDEGKGSIVDWLTVKEKVHTVIRTGGPQALHRVVTSDGREHVFSQFGSGTLRGADTHLSRHMLTAPSALLREGVVLQSKCSHDVFAGITIHKDSLLVTPVQAIAGRVRELLRGVKRRGSVGVGVGEAVRDGEHLKERALYARDLMLPHLEEKLRNLWQYKCSAYESYADRASGLPEPLGSTVRAELAFMTDASLLQKTIAEFTELAKRIRIVDDDYVVAKILAPDGTIVIEGSQGVLLDRVHGFYPYTTKVRATPETGRDILTNGYYTGRVHSLGILRSYATRHGHGPFVTEDAALTKALPDARNHDDAWQGNFRVGHFDAVASRYTAAVCGAGAIDNIVLTCLDRTTKLKTWSVCTSYQYESSALPNNEGGLMGTTHDLFDLKKKYSKQLSHVLSECRPVFRHMNQRRTTEQWRSQCQIQTIAELLEIPVYATSRGATEIDKFEWKY